MMFLLYYLVLWASLEELWKENRRWEVLLSVSSVSTAPSALGNWPIPPFPVFLGSKQIYSKRERKGRTKGVLHQGLGRGWNHTHGAGSQALVHTLLLSSQPTCLLPCQLRAPWYSSHQNSEEGTGAIHRQLALFLSTIKQDGCQSFSASKTQLQPCLSPSPSYIWLLKLSKHLSLCCSCFMCATSLCCFVYFSCYFFTFDYQLTSTTVLIH